jgi:hypothetical protein
MPIFKRYIGIDYSGAQTPGSPLKGLRVYLAEGIAGPTEVMPPLFPSRKYWSRREIAEWLIQELRKDIATFVGIDHGFSFPVQYFEQHQLPPDWNFFLKDFQQHWPTHEEIYVDEVRNGIKGNGSARTGNSRWRRLSEQRSIKAKSVFHFDVPGSVAKSTHTGLPWLLHIRNSLDKPVHFWPFDGWAPPKGRSVITEAYPSLWSKNFDMANRTQDQHDAFTIAAHVSFLDKQNQLAPLFTPDLTEAEKITAQLEGWILGV